MPEAATDDYIERIIANKKEWIESQLKHFNENYQKPKEKEMVSGESFKYLGKNYRLKIIESNEEYVRLYRGYIEIHVKDKNNTAKFAFSLLNDDIYPLSFKAFNINSFS